MTFVGDSYISRFFFSHGDSMEGQSPCSFGYLKILLGVEVNTHQFEGFQAHLYYSTQLICVWGIHFQIFLWRGMSWVSWFVDPFVFSGCSRSLENKIKNKIKNYDLDYFDHVWCFNGCKDSTLLHVISFMKYIAYFGVVHEDIFGVVHEDIRMMNFHQTTTVDQWGGNCIVVLVQCWQSV